MESITLSNSKILIKEGLISNCWHLIAESIFPCKVLIITDKNVAKIYLSKIQQGLKSLGFKIQAFIVNPSERDKSLKTIIKIYDFLSLSNMSRLDLVISLGGGIVSDIAGFAASTYNRGIGLINIPTSLLAMIDAAIGGKNGINSNYGKNIVGTFYHPKLVLIDPNSLKTLPETQLYCGIAEAIKCGCIRDEKLFEILENHNFKHNIYEIIIKSIMVKKNLVELDEKDFNNRMLLNFGHTIGHALEKMGDYKKISHGQAVAIGMNEITKISELLGFTRCGTLKRLKSVCEKYHLPIKSEFSHDQLQKIILYDKKVLNGYLNLVLLKSIGEGFIYKIPIHKIDNFFRKIN